MRKGLILALLLLAAPASGSPSQVDVIEVVRLSSGIDCSNMAPAERVTRPPAVSTGDPDSPMDMVRPLGVFATGLGRLRLDMPIRAHVSLDVFAVNGRRVGGRDIGMLDAGSHELSDLGLGRAAAGVYFARVRVGTEVARAKVINIR